MSDLDDLLEEALDALDKLDKVRQKIREIGDPEENLLCVHTGSGRFNKKGETYVQGDPIIVSEDLYEQYGPDRFQYLELILEVD